MYEKIRATVDELFISAPKTRRAVELKEEILSNLMDKYNDLLASGKSEEDALSIAISGIGDVDELIRCLKEPSSFDNEAMIKANQKYAIMVSSAIGLYIMSVAILILLTAVFDVDGGIAVCIMFLIDAVATFLIIYSSLTKPRYKKADDTMVEEFKEWNSSNANKREIYKSIKSIMWTLITAIYLIVSFVFHIWSFS